MLITMPSPISPSSSKNHHLPNNALLSSPHPILHMLLIRPHPPPPPSLHRPLVLFIPTNPYVPLQQMVQEDLPPMMFSPLPPHLSTVLPPLLPLDDEVSHIQTSTLLLVTLQDPLTSPLQHLPCLIPPHIPLDLALPCLRNRLFSPNQPSLLLYQVVSPQHTLSHLDCTLALLFRNPLLSYKLPLLGVIIPLKV